MPDTVDLAAALARFSEIVGPSNVVAPDVEGFADRYADPFAFDEVFAAPPAGAVLPGTTGEVQDVVRAANEFGVTLWTISRGRNLGYGGAAPRTTGAIVLDLGRLDRIREVNTDSAYAVVEPGVSYFALSEHLRSADIPLWPSVPDLGGGSVIGNALERGFGYTRYGDHSATLCGLEVVLPDGELIRTGMGAMDGSPAGHLYKGGYGPNVDGLFFQSNLGIVVSAGVWLMPRPELAAACLIHVPGEEQLGALVDLIRPSLLAGVIDSVVIVGNALAIASQLMPRSAIFDGDGRIPDAAIMGVTDRLGVGRWNAKFGLYGPQSVVEAKLKVLREAVAGLSGAVIDVRTYPGGVDPVDVHPSDRAQLGIPSGDLIQMAAWRGGEPAHTDFSLVAPTTGDEAQHLVDVVRTTIEHAGFDHAGGFTIFGRHAIMLSLLSFNRSDPVERQRVKELFSALISVAQAEGYAPYRAHPAFMDEIADVYDFNLSALRRLVTRIKAAVDPVGILSPGKQGIWPSDESSAPVPE